MQAHRKEPASVFPAGHCKLVPWAFVALSLSLAACSAPQGGPGAGGVEGRSYSRGQAARPADISGQSPATVRQWLGTPGLTRREPPAEVWQYTAQSCVLDVVFYPHNSGMAADFLDSRDMDGRPLDSAACLQKLAR